MARIRMSVHRNLKHDTSGVCIECESFSSAGLKYMRCTVWLVDLINRAFACTINIRLKNYKHVPSVTVVHRIKATRTEPSLFTCSFDSGS